MVKTLRDKRRRRTEPSHPDGLPQTLVERITLEPLPMLICSDHHLGEHGKDLSRVDYVKKIRDRELCAWLEHYATHRLDDRPWRLVINGDFVDFLAVTFTPSRDELADGLAFELSDHESRFGLDNSSPKVVWKLEHIYDRHKVLFTYLADFVARGNHLEMLYGNHDVEFYWPAVQRRFVELLIEAFFGGERVEGVSPQDFHDRVRFHEWFLYVPGRIYIEHGNQYDDFCSFDQVMRPLCPFDEHQIAMPIAHQIIRYFVNQYEGFRSHGKDNWTLLDYVTWFRDQGLQNFVRILLLYSHLFSRTWSYARTVHETVLRPEAVALHARLVDAEAERYGMAPRVARELNEARMRPLESTIGSIIQVTSLDKYLLGLSLGSLILTVLAVGALADLFGTPGASLWTSSGFRLLSLTMIGLLGFFAWKLIDRLTARFVGKRLSTRVAPKLDRAAERLARILDVPHIVMGHTHRPLQRVVHRSPDVTYTNTGAWIPAHRRERDQLTYAIYDWDRQEVSLFEWDTRAMAPRPFGGGLPATARRGPSALEVDQAALLEALEKFAPPSQATRATARKRPWRRRKKPAAAPAGEPGALAQPSDPP